MQLDSEKGRISWWKRIFGREDAPAANVVGECATCGSRKFKSVSLQQLRADCPFVGSAISCRSCQRVFFDPSILLDDKKTIQPLDVFLKSGAGSGQLRLSPTIFLNPDPGPPRTTIYRCILGRAYQSEIGKQFLQDFLLFCILARNTLTRGRITERLAIEIDGYSEDKREIWQIPELASFFYMLHAKIQIPAIEFWLSEDSLKVFLKAAVAGIPQEPKREVLQLSAAMAAVMKENNLLADSKDFGSEEVQLMRWLLTEAQTKTEFFWNSAMKKKNEEVQRIMSESELTKMLRMLTRAPLAAKHAAVKTNQ
jgi:hypothetical protein